MIVYPPLTLARRRGELFGKRFLIGYAEVNLEMAALFCAANQVSGNPAKPCARVSRVAIDSPMWALSPQAPMLKRYRLRKAAQEGAPEVHRQTGGDRAAASARGRGN